MTMRTVHRLAMFALVSLMAGTATAQSTPPISNADYDVVIRNGRVLDGMGNPWILADVAIKDGKFVRIGRVTGTAAKEIDASGLYVSPGWIDMMDQSGGLLPLYGLAENKIRQGVTTAVGGEGGFIVSASGISGYLSRLGQSGTSINFGSYYSAAQARRAVLKGFNRAPTPAELDRMRLSVDTAMRAGALGLTTALIYPPGSYARTEELIELAKVAAQYGGIYASHVRDEGQGVVQAVGELIRIAEEAGLPGEVFHLKVAHKPGWGILMDSVRQVIEAARARNVDVAADLYVYTASGTGLEATIPSWAAEGGRDSLVKRLADPAIRARLKCEVVTGSPGWFNSVAAAGGWDGVVLVNAKNPANAHYEQQTLSQIGREMGKDPADAAWDLVVQGNSRVMAIYHMMSEQDIETALQFPWTSIGSDAGSVRALGELDVTGLPHPRAYGNAVRVISRYVKERQVLSLEEAIRKQTSWPATRMRLAGRGSIKEGQWADVTIFDLAALDDRASFANPLVSPVGIEYVLVNGIVTLVSVLKLDGR